MATTVPENLKKILQARYGEEVRGAIHDSIKSIYDYTEGPDFEKAVQAIGRLYYSDATTPNEYRDFNNLPPNRIFGYAYNSGTLTNTPTDNFTGVVVTMSYNQEVNTIQIALTYSSAFYYRLRWNSAWSDWKSIPNYAVHGYGSLFDTNVPSEYKDFDTVPANAICLYNANNGLLKNTPTDNFTGYLVPLSFSNDRHLQIQFAATRTGEFYYRSSWGSGIGFHSWQQIPTKKYIKDLIAQIQPGSGDGKVYYVGFSDKSGNYTNLIDCFEDAKTYSGHKTIYIHSGTYDIYSLMGGDDYFNKFTGDEKWDENQPVLDNVDIIGIGNVLLTMEIPSSIPRNVQWLFSPLNVRGNFSIENITIKATNCRYCIHDESGSNYPNTIHKYKNVRCYSSGTTAQAIGCGYSPNVNVELDDCYFYIESDQPAYSYHAKGFVGITFNNCIFERGSSGNSYVRLSQEGNYEGLAVFNNCIIDQITVRPEYAYSDSPECGTNIQLLNTKIVKISRQQYTSGVDAAKSYNTIAGTKEDISYTNE